jgi:hypothetical protein
MTPGDEFFIYPASRRPFFYNIFKTEARKSFPNGGRSGSGLMIKSLIDVTTAGQTVAVVR